MSVVPAAGLGLLVVFLLGTGLTYFILDIIVKRRKRQQTLYRETLREVRPGFLTESRIERLSMVGGGIAVVILIILLALLPLKSAILIEVGLVVVGFIFGMGTFILSRQESEAKPQNVSPPKNRSPKAGVIEGHFVDSGQDHANKHNPTDTKR